MDEKGKQIEELKKEAEEMARKKLPIPSFRNNRVFFARTYAYEDGYIDGAEPREKRIAELKAQIEKMKCCGNCKYSNQEGAYTIVCKVGGVDKTDYIEIEDNQVCEKWELRR